MDSKSLPTYDGMDIGLKDLTSLLGFPAFCRIITLLSIHGHFMTRNNPLNSNIILEQYNSKLLPTML